MKIFSSISPGAITLRNAGDSTVEWGGLLLHPGEVVSFHTGNSMNSAHWRECQEEMHIVAMVHARAEFYRGAEV